MINQERRKQFLDLMAESGWDLLLLYGHSWRKDFFRSLVNFNFFGPHAVAALSKSGELSVVLSHPWDKEFLTGRLDASIAWAGAFEKSLSAFARGKTAVAGLELMEARFAEVLHQPISATAAIEELRRFKTPEEIEIMKQAARLADLGYQHFVDTAQVGMPEYELVAEVEAFLKSNGAEDNFMLIA